MAGRSLLKDHWQEQRLFLSRIIAAAIIVLLLSAVLVTRLVQLQIVDFQRFSELSQGNRFRIEPLPPNRGLIYDRNGLVIAENRPNWELVAVGEQIDDLERTLRTTLTKLRDDAPIWVSWPKRPKGLTKRRPVEASRLGIIAAPRHLT